MQKLRSKYPVSESAYLAAAKARSQQQMESQERQATDEDYQKIQQEKLAQFGSTGWIVDDWEASRKEAGNVESQILIPIPNPTSTSSSRLGGGTGGDDNGEDEEPKLLLF
jgi:hypothetical protein